MKREFPLVVVDNVRMGRHFVLSLNEYFPGVFFFVKKHNGQLGVYPLDDVSAEEYIEIYQYAQKLFREYEDYDV